MSKQRGNGRVLLGAGGVATAAFCLAPQAQAATYEVDRTDDSLTSACTAAANDCTLRGAIDAANTSTGVEGITFLSSLTGSIVLTGGELPITEGAYLYGPGPVISGNDSSRIFHIDVGTPGEPVGIYDLQLTHGNATVGGAIYNENSALVVSESVLSGNHATDKGGAILNGGEFMGGQYDQVYASTLSGNSAGQGGGAVWANGELGLVDASTFSGNTVTSGPGGGLYGEQGGAVFSSTVAGNSATTGGGIGVAPAETMLVRNTIVSDNPGGDVGVAGGTIDLGFSLVKNTAGATITPSDPASNLIAVDPQLGPLQDNGGTGPLRPPTMRPAATSPVVDKGRTVDFFDQRGFARPLDIASIPNSTAAGADAADIGAVELVASEAAVPSTPVTPTPTPAVKRKCKAKGKSAAPAKRKKKRCKKKRKKKRQRSAL
jgi:hypothetical protein